MLFPTNNLNPLASGLSTKNKTVWLFWPCESDAPLREFARWLRRKHPFLENGRPSKMVRFSFSLYLAQKPHISNKKAFKTDAC